MKKQKFLKIIFFVLIQVAGIAGIIYFSKKHSTPKQDALNLTQSKNTVVKTVPSSIANPMVAERDFKKKFSRNSNATLKLSKTSIQFRQDRKNARPLVGFSLKNRDQILERANEVLQTAMENQKINQKISWLPGEATVTPYSAKVEYRQKAGDLPTFPWGNAVVNLADQGEVTRAEIEWLEDIEEPDPATLQADEVHDTVSEVSTAQNIQVGRVIAWIPAGTKKAVAAYEVIADGVQYIVDGNTGKVLFKRDRRVF